MPDQTDSSMFLLEERILGIKEKMMPGTDGCEDGLEQEYKDVGRIMGELVSHARELKIIDSEYDVDTGIQAVISLYDTTDGIVSLLRAGDFSEFKKAYKKFPNKLLQTAETLHKYVDRERQEGTDITLITKSLVASLVELDFGLPEAALYCEALLGPVKPRNAEYAKKTLRELIDYHKVIPDYANETLNTVYFAVLALDIIFKTRAKYNPTYLPTPENAVDAVQKYLGLSAPKMDSPNSN